MRFHTILKRLRTLFPHTSVRILSLVLVGVVVFGIYMLGHALVSYASQLHTTYGAVRIDLTQHTESDVAAAVVVPTMRPVDPKEYARRMLLLANYPPVKVATTSTATTTSTTTPVRPWPVKDPLPTAGAILPFYRVVAYYGNLYSTKMGALGQYPEAEMFARLKADVKKWEEADPETPVMPALHYIVATAQPTPGKDGMYRFRMPDSEIEKVLVMADKIDAIVFLDIQLGHSSVEVEVPYLEKYLKMPNVHLGLDPEFAMRTKNKPGAVVGTLDASEINYTTNYLANLVRDNNIPPKILVIHRFTNPMLTNSKLITLRPEVQVVIDMDGWGAQARKINTYREAITKQPVQFAGFKLFYKNDYREASSSMMTPAQILKLQPRPIYIQYQ